MTSSTWIEEIRQWVQQTCLVFALADALKDLEVTEGCDDAGDEDDAAEHDEEVRVLVAPVPQTRQVLPVIPAEEVQVSKGGPRPQAPGPKPQAPGPRAQATDPRPQAPDPRPQAPHPMSHTSRPMPHTSFPTPQAPGSRSQALSPQASGLGPQAKSGSLNPSPYEGPSLNAVHCLPSQLNCLVLWFALPPEEDIPFDKVPH